MTICAEFQIPFIRYLSEAGELLQPLPSTLSQKTLVTLYREMVTLRVFDQKAIILQRTGKMGTYASTLGQEAVSVGFGHPMRPDDVLCPMYREYGAMLQRGVTMAEILTFWGGDERGNAYANNPHDFPICVPIATQCLHATGVAKAFQYRKEDRVAVTICGDGGTSEGDFYEALNVTGAWNLPAIFIIANNQWAISVPRDIQSGTPTLAQKAIAAGLHGVQLDGNDIIAMQHVMSEALERARTGKGGTVIEAMTYRLSDHTTADDATRYRSDDELQSAWEKCPLKRLKAYLMQEKLWTETDEDTLQKTAKETVEAAVETYLSRAPEPASAMFDHLYAQLPKAYQEQYQKTQERNRS